MGPIAGSRTGYVFQRITTSGDSFQTDRVHLVHEIRFYMQGGIANETVRIGAEGMDLFAGSQVPIKMLNARVHADEPSNLVVFRPERPIRWDPSFPIVIVPSGTVDVILIGEPIVEKA